MPVLKLQYIILVQRKEALKLHVAFLVCSVYIRNRSFS